MIWGELFAGIRGFGLGLEAIGHRTAWAADIEPFCQEVMRLRAPGLEVLGDVRLIDAGAPRVDGLAGGFPCQPVSAAGKGLAQADERWLWPEFFRVIQALEPKLVLIENVPMLRRRGMIDVLRDLASAGYTVAWDGVPAAAVGAPHLRDRVWIVAYSPEMVALRPFGDPVRMLPDWSVSDDGRKIPRAGQMIDGQVWEASPVAPVKTTRRDGWSYWNGVQLGAALPGALVPTPVARDWKGQGMASQLRTNAALGLWPTPRASSGSSISGGGEGGTYYRTPSQQAGTHGRYLQSEVCEVEAEAGRERGPLNPAWVEWLMGFPSGYTDLSVPNEELEWRPWLEEPLPRVLRDVPRRKERLQACGNALVPQIAALVAGWALGVTR